MTYQDLRKHLVERLAHPAVGRAMKWGRYVLVALIVFLLVLQLTKVGWAEFFRSLPSTPFYYLLFLGIYFGLPVMETVIFGTIWPIKRSELLGASLKKRVFNKDVLGYSGEVFLAVWAAGRMGRPRRQVAAEVKDSMVLSVVITTAWTVLLLGALLAIGALRPGEDYGGHSITQIFVLSAVVIVIPVAIGVWFRRKIFRLATRDLARIAGLHLTRILGVAAMQIVQWKVVLPEVPLRIWFTFLATALVISRIPFLPSRDLLFAGAGIELSRMLAIPQAPVAGMLLVSSVLDKLLNIAFFTALSRSASQQTARSGSGTEDVPEPRSGIEETDSAP